MVLNRSGDAQEFRWPQRRLLPLHGLLGGLTVGFLAWALLAGGPYAVGAGLIGLAAGTLWIALLRATLRTPRRRPLPVLDSGTQVARGSVVTAGLLVGAWVQGVAGTVAWVVGMWRDVDRGPGASGFVISLVICVLLSLPNFVRLLAGRLRVWRIEAHDDRLDYVDATRTYSVAWSSMSSVNIDCRKSDLVLTRTDGEPPVRIPLLVFDLPPAQLVELVTTSRASEDRREP